MESENEKLDLVLDRNIIKGVPWAEEMWTVLENNLNQTFLYWCQMVLKMADNEDVIKEWVDIFTKSHEERCCELVADMESLQRKVLQKIEQLLQEFEKLCHTLQIKMPGLGDTTQQRCLYREQHALMERIDEYRKLIDVKRAELKKLQKKQLDLCNILGKEPKILKLDPLPSSEEVEEFHKHIEKLEAEKFNRLEKFLSIKEELLEIVTELNLEPSTQFEGNVFSPDDSLFLVTDENMKQLDMLHKSLVKQQKNVKEEIAHLRNKIEDYWNRLDVNLKEREDFRQKYIGNTLEVLEALRTEVKHCEDLKKANIKVFIDKLRFDLDHLWNKCHCGEEVKTQFGFFYSDCYNEDLLELHEVEIGKWERYYEDNKELLSLLDKHQLLWKKMVQLEANATGPNRYNNRGGQLLKEEKERNKLAKQIPQIEETLFNLADKYREHHDASFTSYGTTVEDYLANLHEERENTKKQKLSARKMQREQTLTPAKSALSIFPSTSHHTLRLGTPSTTKRKLITTPATEETKRPKILSERKQNKIEKTATPVIKITSTSGRTKRYSVERNKRLNKIRRLSSQKPKGKVNPNETFTADYSDFQNQISNREDCRSTIIPTETTPARTPLSKPSRMKTPTNILISTPKTPRQRTPTTNQRLRARTPDSTNKLSAAKSNIKLIF